MTADPNDGQTWTTTDLLEWGRTHAPELVDIIENPASDIPGSAVLSDRLVTALWFWEDNSHNKLFINAQRAKRLADYYSALGDAETLARMRANFEVDRGRADRFAKRRSTKKEVRHELIRDFVFWYKHTASPDTFNTNSDTPDPDLCDEEREDLRKGVREKWAIHRASEHYGLDDRTIREAVNPSKRSRSKT
jgi:hypothetical protein